MRRVLCVAFAVVLLPHSLLASRFDDLTFEVPLDPRRLSIEGEGSYDRIRLEGGDRRVTEDTIGKPDLPVIYLDVLLPPDATVRDVVVTRGRARVIEGQYVPTPIQRGFQDEGDDEFVEGDSDTYESLEPYPSRAVSIEGAVFTRGVQTVRIAVWPLEYVGALRELRYYPVSHVQVALSTEDARGPLTVRERKRAGSRWTARGLEREWLARQVTNFDQFAEFYVDTVLADSTSRPQGRSKASSSGFLPSPWPSLHGSRVEYVIITDSVDVAGRNVGDLPAEFERLAEWKTQRGVPAVVRTVHAIESQYPGLDLAEQIRNFIIEAYELWGVDWVLLAGDTDVVPARRLTPGDDFSAGRGEQPADPYFGCLDGSWNGDRDWQFGEPTTAESIDVGWEVFVGRAPVETPAEAMNYVDKVLSYERRPGLPLGDVGATYETILLMDTLTNDSGWIGMS